MVVAKALAWKGPSGWYSQTWISRALQSFSSTKPKIMVSASAREMGRPMALGVPTTAPISSSMSSLRQGAKIGASLSGGLIWPSGRWISVPSTTTVLARPL